MDKTTCYRCGHELSGCHKRCPNCGSVNYCRDGRGVPPAVAVETRGR